LLKYIDNIKVIYKAAIQLLAKQSIYKIYVSIRNKPPIKDPTGGSRNTQRDNTITKKVWEIQLKRSF